MLDGRQHHFPAELPNPFTALPSPLRQMTQNILQTLLEFSDQLLSLIFFSLRQFVVFIRRYHLMIANRRENKPVRGLQQDDFLLLRIGSQFQ